MEDHAPSDRLALDGSPIPPGGWMRSAGVNRPAPYFESSLYYVIDVLSDTCVDYQDTADAKLVSDLRTEMSDQECRALGNSVSARKKVKIEFPRTSAVSR